MVLEQISKPLVFSMATLEPRQALWAETLLHLQWAEMLLLPQWAAVLLQWAVGILLLPLMRSTNLRPLTTQASSTSRSRFENIVEGNKEIDHLKLIVT